MWNWLARMVLPPQLQTRTGPDMPKSVRSAGAPATATVPVAAQRVPASATVGGPDAPRSKALHLQISVRKRLKYDVAARSGPDFRLTL